jgi:type III pantothenate kinase
MLLAIDVGNTNIVMGVNDGKTYTNVWRLTTNKERTADEFGAFYLNMFRAAGLELEAVDAIIVSSVVPGIMYTLNHSLEKYFNVKPLLVEPGIKTGLNIQIDHPKDLGADIIVNLVAAYELYGGPAIVVDFGTATTFSCVTKKFECPGVVICAGVKVTAEALYKRAANLPNIDIMMPPKIIGKNTINSMQSGIICGYQGLIANVVDNMKRELAEDYGQVKEDIKVIATGGLLNLIAKKSDRIGYIDNQLTLNGLKIVYDKNKPKAEGKA